MFEVVRLFLKYSQGSRWLDWCACEAPMQETSR
jgi:hypothetical protein